jgi:carbonic anhydrase
MHIHRFIKLIISAFLVIFVTMGTAGGWEAQQKESTSHKKPAAKEEVKKKEAGEEQGHGSAPAKEAHGAAAAGGREVIAIEADEAYKKLMDGNKQYVSGKLSTVHSTGARRTEVAKGQHPFAIILSCSDSRVPPEIVFNQGIGDLFVVRTAGHVADDQAIGSIEYAVEHLGVRLIMVLGHERCGAVDATVKGGAAPGHIASVVAAIKPAVDIAKEKPGEIMDNAVKANTKMVAQKLAGAKPFLSEMYEDGVLKILGAVYDLDTGAVALTYNPK